jgi:predicted amidohydrolase YtcJ
MYTLFYNGHIHTLEDEIKHCEALLVLKNRIVYCGKSMEINIPDHLVTRIDLKERHVFPGFIDCHTHIAAVALALERINLDNCLTREAALQKIRENCKNYKRDEWILGSGWNANIWPDGDAHRVHLDDLGVENPIALYSKDGHALWLNSRALHLSGLSDLEDDPPGGKRDRDPDGQLRGIVYETCCNIVDSVAEQVRYETLNRCLQRLYPQLYALGITSVHSCEGLDIYKLFQEMELNRRLRIRICMHPPENTLADLQQAGLHSAWGNDWLRFGGLKYFVDGSLGSQTAEMFENFSGLDHSGIEVISEEILTEKLSNAAKAGWSATIHAIGDKANYKTLNALTAISRINSPVPLRQRIEHCQIIQSTDLERFYELKVIASMQPLHIADDVKIAETYLGERTSNTYPIKSLLQAGTHVVFGSDMPIADPDPIKGMIAAVSRRYQLDENESSWNPDESVSARQALLAYTRDAAFASYEESAKGTLYPGKLADFIVLSKNLEDAGESDLRACRVEMTVLDGEIVFTHEKSALFS